MRRAFREPVHGAEVKTAQFGCGFLYIARGRGFVKCQQVLNIHNAEGTMLDFLFTVGQAVSAMLILYGGYLVVTQALPVGRKAPVLNPALEDEQLLLKHIHNDA